jgi:hypothetical protein
VRIAYAVHGSGPTLVVSTSWLTRRSSRCAGSTTFGDRVTDIDARVQSLVVDNFASGEEFRDYFKRNYGPTIAVYRFIADDVLKVAALDADLAELGRRFGLGNGSRTMEWEYLLFTARRS